MSDGPGRSPGAASPPVTGVRTEGGPVPVLPDYGGACLASVVPALLSDRADPPAWVPAPLRGANQVVLLVVDGLGWEQLRMWPTVAPALAGAAGGPITSVVPTTTATALTSLTTGAPPSGHGVVGYRVRVDGPERPGLERNGADAPGRSGPSTRTR